MPRVTYTLSIIASAGSCFTNMIKGLRLSRRRSLSRTVLNLCSSLTFFSRNANHRFLGIFLYFKSPNFGVALSRVVCRQSRLYSQSTRLIFTVPLAETLPAM